jgi:hypothetical protein
MKKPTIPNEVLEYFRKQGMVGGNKRAERLTPERRSAIARKAVQARWRKQKGKAD